METAISIKNISKKFGSNEVLKNINLEVKKGEFLCLLGPSGCGKSTLLRLIAGLETPTTGEISLNGEDATYLPPSKRNFGIVFQSYALFPNLTASENVAYGLKNRKISQKNIYEKVDYLFEMIRLSDAKNRYPSQLSGGEQQRVALARALAVNPDFLLLDEPLSALDAKVRLRLRRQICEIQQELNLTTIMVTHDQDEALTMAQRIVVMNKAEIMQWGTPEEIYSHPQNRFVADFIGSINFWENSQTDNVLAIRPEDIEILPQNTCGDVHAKILDLEFRGGFSRLTVRTEHALQNNELMIDVSQETIEQHSLNRGKDIYLKMPKEKTLSFPR